MARRQVDKDKERETVSKDVEVKGRRSSKKKGYKDKTKDSEDVRVKSDYKYNDVSYYIKNPELLAQATQISFQNILGIEPIGEYEIPTIMRIYMNPSVGLTYQGSSSAFLNHPSRAGINLASIKLFNRLSMSSGRNMSYAPQDLGIMLGALSQVLAMISFGRRVLGTTKLCNYRNRMFPKAMVEAMGFDYDDLVANWSDYRTAFNNEITVLNQIPIIVNAGYIKKSMNQYDFIFTDSESPMAQMYVYMPASTWIIDETTSQDGSVLRTLTVTGSDVARMTFANFMQTILRPMVDALVTSSTLNLVYADILHLASKDPTVELYSVPILPDDYVVMPIHNYEALLHIHNMTSIGIPNLATRTGYDTPFNDVYCDPNSNNLIYNPCFTLANFPKNAITERVIIDSPTPEPDLDMKLEMTRYKSMWTNNVVTINSVQYVHYVLLTDYYVCYTSIISNDVDAPLDVPLAGNSTNIQSKLCKMSQFDWAPLVIQTAPISGSNMSKIVDIHGDLNYYTEVSKFYIERLMSIVYLGLFEM